MAHAPYTTPPPSPPHTPTAGLGHALYDSSFRGGRSARYESLAREVQPVLADMLLMVTADGGFWPTPGRARNIHNFVKTHEYSTELSPKVNRRHRIHY